MSELTITKEEIVRLRNTTVGKEFAPIWSKQLHVLCDAFEVLRSLSDASATGTPQIPKGWDAYPMHGHVVKAYNVKSPDGCVAFVKANDPNPKNVLFKLVDALLAAAPQPAASPPEERTIPEEVQEWIWHMDLHLTEHDDRHAGLALRAAWPSVRLYFLGKEAGTEHKLICPRCQVDRLKVGCPEMRQALCPMVGKPFTTRSRQE